MLTMKPYLIALDPGKSPDPAAIQVYKTIPSLVHPDPLIAEEGKVIYRDDIVMQYKLSDRRYTELVEFVVNLMSRKSLSNQCVLVFDATGVGKAVKDMFWDRGIRDMIPIVYTAGGKASYVYRDESDKRFQPSTGRSAFTVKTLDEIRVPKPDLVDAAKLELERHGVRVAKGVPYREEFERQMIEFRGKMNAKGYVSYNNSKDEIHDEWPNCFMMRSYIRNRFRADIYRNEETYEKKAASVVGLREIMGDRLEDWR